MRRFDDLNIAISSNFNRASLAMQQCKFAWLPGYCPVFHHSKIGGNSSDVAMDLKTGKGLVHGHQLDAVDVDMLRL